MKICILGKHGFIGSALSRKLLELGHEVISNPINDVAAIVHLASPTHLDFEKNVEYHMTESIASFQSLLPFCHRYGIHFVYASSALIYEDEKITPFKNCKKILEQMANVYPSDTLGMRIFPVYGVGEDRTAISKWCKQMKQGQSPVVYGDGTQKRDFVYVDDVIDQIIEAIDTKYGIMDVGTGKATSFNEIIETINEELKTNIKPTYISSPSGYSEGIFSKHPVLTKVSLRDGIRKILATI